MSNFYFDDDPSIPGFYGEFVAAFWDEVSGAMFTPVRWEVEAEVTYLEDTTGQTTAVGTWAGASGTGKTNIDPLPYSTQFQVDWLTGVYAGGRQIRGKTYIPGLTEDTTTGGVFNSNVVGPYLDAATQLISDGNGAMRVYSPTRNTSAVITGATTTPKPAVLRSRRD
uniref:Uncharacterized protein n=1 Tax=uncultured prokaryote TaxID=198431 RepID=A0A0H5Q5V6_9ZZZZ|nr:hypothetical protein [uncultured prokaryote]